MTGRILVAGAAIGLAAIATPAAGHGGGLDAKGCHTNRKTGDYHCHRAQSAARPSAAPRRQSFAGSTYFANCAAARAAGAAPVRRGDPGYSTKLDRDRDGVGCE